MSELYCACRGWAEFVARSALFLSDLPIKTLCALVLAPVRAECFAYLIVVDLITQINI